MDYFVRKVLNGFSIDLYTSGTIKFGSAIKSIKEKNNIFPRLIPCNLCLSDNQFTAAAEESFTNSQNNFPFIYGKSKSNDLYTQISVIEYR